MMLQIMHLLEDHLASHNHRNFRLDKPLSQLSSQMLSLAVTRPEAR